MEIIQLLESKILPFSEKVLEFLADGLRRRYLLRKKFADSNIDVEEEDAAVNDVLRYYQVKRPK